MKLTNLLKKFIFLSTLIIIIFLSIINQRQSTKLKILIWSTPSLSLGSYLAISTGTGFLVSYFVTASLYGLSKDKQPNKIKYKFEKQSVKNKISNEPIKTNIYDKTLIERDINDPSPTMNATFRVIGNTNKKEQSLQNEYNNEYYSSDTSVETDYQFNKTEVDDKNTGGFSTILNDCEDDSYANW